MTFVIADEAHERTIFIQMIIGLTRLQMANNSEMVLILMSATVDVEQLKNSIPGCPAVFHPEVFFVTNLIVLENALALTAKLIVPPHLEYGNRNFVEDVFAGTHCVTFCCSANGNLR